MQYVIFLSDLLFALPLYISIHLTGEQVLIELSKYFVKAPIVRTTLLLHYRVI